MSRHDQVIGGGPRTLRRPPTEWCDGYRKGRAASRGRCEICSFPITAGDEVGRYPYPKRLAHWACVGQLHAEHRTTPASCHTCGRPATGEAHVRGRLRPTCEAHAP